MLDLDASLHPELAAQQVRVGVETALTNRLYAIVEFLKAKPIFPRLEEGTTDDVCFKAWRTAWLRANDAVAEIAEATVCWAGEDRGERGE